MQAYELVQALDGRVDEQVEGAGCSGCPAAHPDTGAETAPVEVHGSLLRIVGGTLTAPAHHTRCLIEGETGKKFTCLIQSTDSLRIPVDDRDVPLSTTGVLHHPLKLALDLVHGVDHRVSGGAAIVHEVDEHLLTLGAVLLLLKLSALPRRDEFHHRIAEGDIAVVRPPVLFELAQVRLGLVHKGSDPRELGIPQLVLREELQRISGIELGQCAVDGSDSVQYLIVPARNAVDCLGQDIVAVHPDHFLRAVQLEADHMLVPVHLVAHEAAELQAVATPAGITIFVRLLHAGLELLESFAFVRLCDSPVVGARFLDIPRLDLGEEAVIASPQNEVVQRLLRPVLEALHDLLLGDVAHGSERIISACCTARSLLRHIASSHVAGEHRVVVQILGGILGEPAERDVVLPHPRLALSTVQSFVLGAGKETVLVCMLKVEVGAGADAVPHLVEQVVVVDTALEVGDHRTGVVLRLLPLFLLAAHEGGDTGVVAVGVLVLDLTALLLVSLLGPLDRLRLLLIGQTVVSIDGRPLLLPLLRKPLKGFLHEPLGLCPLPLVTLQGRHRIAIVDDLLVSIQTLLPTTGQPVKEARLPAYENILDLADGLHHRLEVEELVVMHLGIGAAADKVVPGQVVAVLRQVLHADLVHHLVDGDTDGDILVLPLQQEVGDIPIYLLLVAGLGAPCVNGPCFAETDIVVLRVESLGQRDDIAVVVIGHRGGLLDLLWCECDDVGGIIVHTIHTAAVLALAPELHVDILVNNPVESHALKYGTQELSGRELASGVLDSRTIKNLSSLLFQLRRGQSTVVCIFEDLRGRHIVSFPLPLVEFFVPRIDEVKEKSGLLVFVLVRLVVVSGIVVEECLFGALVRINDNRIFHADSCGNDMRVISSEHFSRLFKPLVIAHILIAVHPLHVLRKESRLVVKSNPLPQSPSALPFERSKIVKLWVVP